MDDDNKPIEKLNLTTPMYCYEFSITVYLNALLEY